MSERIDMRVPDGAKALLMEAAERRGESLTTFLYKAARARMAKDLREQLPDLQPPGRPKP